MNEKLLLTHFAKWSRLEKANWSKNQKVEANCSEKMVHCSKKMVPCSKNGGGGGGEGEGWCRRQIAKDGGSGGGGGGGREGDGELWRRRRTAKDRGGGAHGDGEVQTAEGGQRWRQIAK